MNRIKWVDLARAVAIVLVVVCHSTESAYGLTLESMSTVGAIESAFAFACFTAGRMGVPLFLFMTGYLLMSRDYDEQACINFWKHRWLPLLFCAEAWILIYNAFLVSQGYDISLNMVLRDMLFLREVEMEHFWYIPLIVGIYLLLPVMAMGLNRLNPKTLLIPLSILIAFAFFIPAVNVVFKAIDISTLSVKINYGFSGGVYGLYVIAGWAVKKGAFDNVLKSTLATIGIASFAALVALQMWAFSESFYYAAWYNNILLLVAAIALFCLFSRIEEPLAYPAVKSLAYYSFAIYLIHMPIMLLIEPYVLPLPLPKSMLLVSLTVVVVGIAWGIAWAMGKIPFVGKRLLLLK